MRQYGNAFGALGKPNFRFYRADIADREAVYGIFEREGPAVVVNFAAESHVDRSIENPALFLETNVMGTQVLLDACRRYGIGRFHQVSTDEVYGDLPLDRPDLLFTEETPIRASSPYSASRPPPTCWSWPTTGLTGCPRRFPAAQTTTGRITSRKSSSRS
jgi:dTDP-D-glucose 4,6-dehydratase